ncbi:MAG: alkaline phosphatase family protein [Deltaproteobacteria bacterium]|nr:alkaline phosphatase family protein [Deltaproteobacteria bacterium]
MRRRVMVIGLDCADPRQSFGRLAHACPNLAALCRRGEHGRLRSTVPPITVPAWTTMMSGVSPGELGLYGLRARVPGSYQMRVVTAADVLVPRVWEVAARASRKAVIVGVPQTYPLPQRQGVDAVSCFLTPSASSPFASPRSLEPELRRLFGEYKMDVPGFRSLDRARILRELYAMTAQRFAIAEHLARTREWDLFMVVDMGLDRFHHAFWQTWNEDHAAYDADGPFRGEAERYYAFVDERLGELLSLADDDTAVLVVSDHGARTLEGGVCVNEALADAGLLALPLRPARPTRLDEAGVDWDRTVAWAEGGYYARVFLNVRGREPRGALEPGARERVRDEVARLLRETRGLGGRSLDTRVVRPEEVYPSCSGAPPDLMVFFGDLAYRAVGSVGHGAHQIAGCDTGPDGCNHDWDGLYVLARPGGGSATADRRIEDVGKLVLDLLDVPDGLRPAALGGAA